MVREKEQGQGTAHLRSAGLRNKGINSSGRLRIAMKNRERIRASGTDRLPSKVFCVRANKAMPRRQRGEARQCTDRRSGGSQSTSGSPV